MDIVRPYNNFEISPPNLYALPSPTNMTTVIRENAKFPISARSS